MMKCHNCAVSLPFSAFLKQVDEHLYKEYLFETFKYNNEYRWYDKKAADRNENVETELEVKKITTKALSKLKCVADLDEDHPCKQYVRKRKIPFRYWQDLYYAENYQKWVHQNIDKEKFKYHPDKDPRLVIPFKTKKGKVFAYQGRYIGDDPKQIRYITINPNDSVLVYGLDKIDTTKTVYVLEGPIDSMYIDNAIAVAGSSLKKFKNFVCVFDNEPRARTILKLMKRVIDLGGRVVIWPNDLQYKDIGQMIESGMTQSEVQKIIDDNTHSGLEANLFFNEWKKL